LQWGLVELEDGNLSAGIERLEAARRELLDAPGVLNVLGEAYRAAGRAREAREAWARSLARDPNQPEVTRRLQEIELE
jgi:cytochrome c-type biogenesis protein CcmH/NrfG